MITNWLASAAMAVPAKPRNDGGGQNILQAHGVLLSWGAHGIIKNL
jgi:hypothetical protein